MNLLFTITDQNIKLTALWGGCLSKTLINTLCQIRSASIGNLINVERKGEESNRLIYGSGFRVQGSGYRVQGSWFIVQGSGFRVQGSVFRVQGAGLEVEGFGVSTSQNHMTRIEPVPASAESPENSRLGAWSDFGFGVHGFGIRFRV